MINNWETKKIPWELEEPQLTPIQEGDTSMEEANVQKEMAMFQSVVVTMVPKPQKKTYAIIVFQCNNSKHEEVDVVIEINQQEKKIWYYSNKERW